MIAVSRYSIAQLLVLTVVSMCLSLAPLWLVGCVSVVDKPEPCSLQNDHEQHARGRDIGKRRSSTHLDMRYFTPSQRLGVQGIVVGVAILPQSDRLSCVTDEGGRFGVHVLGETASTSTCIIRSGRPDIVAYCSDSRRVAVCTRWNVVTVIDTESLEVLYEHQIQAESDGEYRDVRALAFLDEGDKVVALYDHNTVAVIESGGDRVTEAVLDLDFGNDPLVAISHVNDDCIWAASLSGNVWILSIGGSSTQLLVASINDELSDICGLSIDQAVLEVSYSELRFFSRSKGEAAIEGAAMPDRPRSPPVWCAVGDDKFAFRSSPSELTVLDLVTYEPVVKLDVSRIAPHSLAYGRLQNISSLAVGSYHGHINIFDFGESENELVWYGGWSDVANDDADPPSLIYKHGAVSPSLDRYVLVGIDNKVTYVSKTRDRGKATARPLNIGFRRGIKQCVFLDNDTIAFTDGIAEIAILSFDSVPSIVSTIDLDTDWCRVWPGATKKEWRVVGVSKGEGSVHVAQLQDEWRYELNRCLVTDAYGVDRKEVQLRHRYDFNRNIFAVEGKSCVYVYVLNGSVVEVYRKRCNAGQFGVSSTRSQIVHVDAGVIEVWTIEDEGVITIARYEQASAMLEAVLSWGDDAGLCIDRLGGMHLLQTGQAGVKMKRIDTKRPVGDVRVVGHRGRSAALLVGPLEIVEVDLKN